MELNKSFQGNTKEDASLYNARKRNSTIISLKINLFFFKKKKLCNGAIWMEKVMENRQGL